MRCEKYDWIQEVLSDISKFLDIHGLTQSAEHALDLMVVIEAEICYQNRSEVETSPMDTN